MTNNSTTDSILKYGDKPLKCIVTQNQRTKEFLKNSGSMIIYERPLDEGTSPRELYLGNKFIAGGYGFGTSIYTTTDETGTITTHSLLDHLEEVNELYDSTSTISSIENKLDEIPEMVEEAIATAVLPFLEKDGGDASKTVVLYGEDEKVMKVELDNLFKFLSLYPTYEDIEIKGIDYEITVNDDSKKYTQFDNLPIGHYITSLKATINGNANDSGGINQVFMELGHDIGSATGQITINNKLGASVTDNILLTLLYTNYSSEISPTKVKYTIQPGENSPITSCVLKIAGSPTSTINEKYVTIHNETSSSIIQGLNIEGAMENLVSTYNVIEDHELDISELLPKVNGVDYIYYNKTTAGNFWKEGKRYNIVKYKDYDNIFYTQLDIDNLNITSELDFRIPEGYKIQDAIFYDQITFNKYSIKNFINMSSRVISKYNTNFVNYTIKTNISDYKVGNPFFNNITGISNKGKIELLLTYSDGRATEVYNTFDDEDISKYWLTPKTLQKIYQTS